MTDRVRWTIRMIATELGFSESVVKKWRGNTIKALRRAGQLDSVEPRCPLPTNALPLPVNQREHVQLGDPPLFDPDVVIAWAKRTQRRHPVTDVTTHPSPPGRPADPDKPPRRRGKAKSRRIPGWGHCTRHGSFTGTACPACPVAVAA